MLNNNQSTMINNGVQYWHNHCYHVQQTNSIIFHFGSVVSEDKIRFTCEC